MRKVLPYLVVSGLAALLVVVLVAMNLLDASQRRLRTVEQLEVTFDGEGWRPSCPGTTGPTSANGWTA